MRNLNDEKYSPGGGRRERERERWRGMAWGKDEFCVKPFLETYCRSLVGHLWHLTSLGGAQGELDRS